MKTEAILTQTVEQLEHLNEALVALRREFLPGQPRKFAILAEGPLEICASYRRKSLSSFQFAFKTVCFESKAMQSVN